MRRSAALAPLSRDHQHALAVALTLRRADEGGVADAVQGFAAFFEAEGRVHFRIEEEHVLPALEPGEEWSAAVARVREDHAAIRAAADALPATAEEARALGQRLHDHVRFEERVLFELLERRLSPEDLERLGRAVDAAEREAGSPEGARERP